MNTGALIATFVAGLFFLVGALLNKGIGSKRKILDFSLGMALMVALGLVVFDLLPESLELFGTLNTLYKAFLIVVFAILGIMVLKIIDTLIPEHKHNHKDNCDTDEHHNHISHIGIVTSIALAFHNIIEGIVIYSSTYIDLSMGILLSIGVALHNIPMGMQIFATLNDGNASLKKKILIFSILILSTPLGAIIMMFASNLIANHILAMMISFTMGTLIYIALFELLKEILNNKDKNASIIGIVVGIILVIISALI